MTDRAAPTAPTASAPTASVEIVLQRLQGPALDELAALVVDHLLDHPLAELIDPDWAATQLVRALDIGTRGDQTERWLRERIEQLRDQKLPPGTLSDRLPDELQQPLLDVVGRPMEPDRELVRRLLDHNAVRSLLKDVIRGALHGFIDRVKNLQVGVGGGAGRAARGGLGRLKALGQGVRAVSEGVVGQMGKELEQRMLARAGDFVDEALAGTMAQVADQLSDPSHAAAWGNYRAHVVRTLLETENTVLVAEVEKLDPDHLVEVGAATARALARRDGFEEEVAEVLRAAMEATEGRTLRDFVEETGMEELSGAESEWRRELEAQIVAQARVVVQTPEFEDWLRALMAP